MHHRSFEVHVIWSERRFIRRSPGESGYLEIMMVSINNQRREFQVNDAGIDLLFDFRDKRLQLVDSLRRFSIFISRSRATARASGLP